MFDTNVDNYQVSDLLLIIDLSPGNITAQTIRDRTDAFIRKFPPGDVRHQFFGDVQRRLLSLVGEAVPPAQTITDRWAEYIAPPQTDQTQTKRITDRTQKIDVADNDHVPMTRQQLGVTNSRPVVVAQDQLNPTLKNTTETFVQLDSRYRQIDNQTSTDYTLDLSDRLDSVLSLRLYSYQIPATWYNVKKGSTCFWVGATLVSIAAGNYSSSSTLVTAVNAALGAIGSIANDPITGLTTLTLAAPAYVTFFDPSYNLRCLPQTACANASNGDITRTLGWILGFRAPSVNVLDNPVISQAVISLTGTKYIIMVVDDYNQNHMNSGLVGITELSRQLKLPTYYTPDMPTVCIPPASNLAVLQQATEDGLLIADKLETMYAPYAQLVPSAPRTLTQAQLYTVNEILKNNSSNTTYRVSAPTFSDTFAMISVRPHAFGDMYVDISGSLQDFRRQYFGPVNVERLKVQLYDDQGELLDLNGSDWSCTIIAEMLYQY
jgi:hypothetical protein